MPETSHDSKGLWGALLEEERARQRSKVERQSLRSPRRSRVPESTRPTPLEKVRLKERRKRSKGSWEFSFLLLWRARRIARKREEKAGRQQHSRMQRSWPEKSSLRKAPR